MTEGSLRKSVSFTKILLLTSVPSLYVTLAAMCGLSWSVSKACRDDRDRLSSFFWKNENSLDVNFSSRLIIGMFDLYILYEVIRLS